MKKAVRKKAENAQPGRARSAQDRFLTQLAQERRKVAVFLTNGIKLEGEIKSFDEYTILIEGAMTDHVYKHAVSTIQPLTGVVATAKAKAKAKGYAREHTPGVDTAGGDADGAEDAAIVASGAEVTVKDQPRQPVIVVRPRRRLVKTVADSD